MTSKEISEAKMLWDFGRGKGGETDGTSLPVTSNASKNSTDVTEKTRRTEGSGITRGAKIQTGKPLKQVPEGSLREVQGKDPGTCSRNPKGRSY